MRRAIFPGTFDPFTIGHSSVVTRALTFMDEVIIGIGINENKNTYFPIEKRVEIIQKFYRNEPRIKVYSYDCLTIFCPASMMWESNCKDNIIPASCFSPHRYAGI